MKKEPLKGVKLSVFIPAFTLVIIAVAIGLTNNALLVEIAKEVFYFALTEFAWLYQLLSVATLFIVSWIFFSKAGDIRLGGIDAKPTFSMASNFAMALTGGIATGVVTYSVNEPIIYLGNIYGEIGNQSAVSNSKCNTRFNERLMALPFATSVNSRWV